MQLRRLFFVPTAALLLVGLTGSPILSFTRETELTESSDPFLLSADCNLTAFNTCSNWIWTFTDAQGAVWGHVFDPNDCPGGCLNGGAVESVALYSRCNVVPGDIGGVRIDAVDANNCPTALLCQSGPIELVHCVAGDRWTVIPFDPGGCRLNGNPFAASVIWGTDGEVVLATDNGIANLYCSQGVTGTFPGCFSTVPTCGGYVVPSEQNTLIFVTDFNGDTILDDLCAQYGQPYGLAFPYVAGYGYLVNNLMLKVGLNCSNPEAVEPSSWGHVKALYE